MNDTRPILDYRHNRPTDEKGWSEHTGRTEALFSFICVGVPVAGMILQSGPLYLLGIIFAPILGVILGLSGICRYHARIGTRLAAFAGIALNGLLMYSACYLFFVRGLC